MPRPPPGLLGDGREFPQRAKYCPEEIWGRRFRMAAPAASSKIARVSRAGARLTSDASLPAVSIKRSTSTSARILG
jgi:hypothetical protein